jgi:hypothetical protein
MKHLGRYFLTFLLITVAIIFAPLQPLKPKTKAATEYYVQPYIIIPYNWKNHERVSEDNIARMKNIIINGLVDIQEWYKEVIPGNKTFNFKREVKVVKAEDPLASLPSAPGQICSAFQNLIPTLGIDCKSFETVPIEALFYGVKVGDEEVKIIDKLLPKELLDSIPKNEVPIFWIIGTSSSLESFSLTGLGAATITSQVVIMPWDLLEGLSPSYQIKKVHDFARKALAHELGHAFGLVLAGWAKDHPCTTVSVDNCEQGAPQPLPGPEEWNTVMGYGLIFLQGGFNNSGHNPELWKLYQSPWINPTHDPPPAGIIFPRQPGKKVLPPEITKINPEIVELGGEVEIQGQRFGSEEGKVVLYQSGMEVGSAKIISWNDTLVKITVEKVANALCLTTADQPGQKGQTTCAYIAVREKNPQYLTINANASCGMEVKPVSGATIRLERIFEHSGERETVTSTTTGIDGNAPPIYLPILKTQQGNSVTPGVYQVRADAIAGIISPNVYNFVIFNTESSFERTYNFHYPVCPGEAISKEPATSPSPTPTSAPTTSPTPQAVCTPGEYDRECIGTSGCEYKVFQCTNLGTWEYKGTEVNCELAKLARGGPCATLNSPETTPAITTTVPPSPPTSQEQKVSPARQIVGIEVNGQGLPQDGSEITLFLPGIPGQSATIPVFIKIRYSDGTVKDLVMNFNYNPPQVTGPELCQISQKPGDAYPQCGGECMGQVFNPTHTVFVKVKRDKEGNICGYECQDLGSRPNECGNPTGGTAASPTPTPSPSPTLAPQCRDEFQYNECIGCNQSRPAYKNTCTGEWKTGSPQMDPYCASYCKAAEEGACDDLYYWDPNVAQCIHKWSPNDAYPNCKYAFDWTDKRFCGM